MEELKESHSSGEGTGPTDGGGGGGGGAMQGGGNGGGGAGRSAPGGGPNNGASSASGLHYSIPGILHFLQHEWSRFEMERSQWEVEKAELQARIAFLQGERKGQENLKNDLVRRIKMLEYALKQERAKYNKLKYGSESTNALDSALNKTNEEDEEQQPQIDGDNYIAVSNTNWRQGRQLLRQYLQEIGYTDTIIDVRSNRVRSLLGLNDENINEDSNGGGGNAGGPGGRMVNGGDASGATGQSGGQQNTATQRRVTNQSAGDSASGQRSTSLAQEMLIDTEAAVMANFDFLSSEAEVDDDDDMGDDGDDGYKGSVGKAAAGAGDSEAGTAGGGGTEGVMNEFNFLQNPDGVDCVKTEDKVPVITSTPPLTSDELQAQEWGIDSSELERLKELYKSGSRKGKKGGGGKSNLPRQKHDVAALQDAESGGLPDFMGGHLGGAAGPSGGRASAGTSTTSGACAVDGGAAASGTSGAAKEPADNLELGELEQLTITNDNESSYDITTPKESFRKTWSAKYTLRSHFDGVRALGFHPTEHVLITASEDQTLKLWNLQKTIPAKKSASLDVEPVYTFRGHLGPILSLSISPSGDYLFSGGLDKTIRCWTMPSANIDPYDSYDPSILSLTLTGHTDAVWGLSYHGSRQQLLSCSADGTIRLWSPISNKASPLIKTYPLGNSEYGVPTSVDWVFDDPSHFVAAYRSGACVIYDVETGKQIMKMQTDSIQDPSGAANPALEIGPITRVISHPTLPLTITAHEDRHIRFWDNNTGKLTHAMVAHLDSVTSLSLDTNGLYLISGSHDCSIRLWNLETKTCVQEITAHRKKFDEAIFAVAFHPSKPYIASAGADALAKVFV